jgi:hypothetical protein
MRWFGVAPEGGVGLSFVPLKRREGRLGLLRRRRRGIRLLRRNRGLGFMVWRGMSKRDGILETQLKLRAATRNATACQFEIDDEITIVGNNSAVYNETVGRNPETTPRT